MVDPKYREEIRLADILRQELKDKELSGSQYSIAYGASVQAIENSMSRQMFIQNVYSIDNRPDSPLVIFATCALTPKNTLVVFYKHYNSTNNSSALLIRADLDLFSFSDSFSEDKKKIVVWYEMHAGLLWMAY